MEKLEIVTQTKEVRIHHFYCNDCNTYLGKSEEYDDGYYTEPGEFNLNFGAYHLNKHLCEECYEKFLKKLNDALLELGFNK